MRPLINYSFRPVRLGSCFYFKWCQNLACQIDSDRIKLNKLAFNLYRISAVIKRCCRKELAQLVGFKSAQRNAVLATNNNNSPFKRGAASVSDQSRNDIWPIGKRHNLGSG